MKNIKKTTIIVETERVIVLSRQLIREHCQQCDEEAGFLALNDAAVFCGTSPETMRCQIQERQLHAKEADGFTLICFHSLTR
jgi:hypothetical protein